MNRISVIIPVYNAQKTLPAVIQAVLTQTHRDLELLLVDDGSTDGSAALCDGCPDCRVRAFHQENRGAWAARNLGLAHAAGAYIAFVDADDRIPPDYLEILLDTIRDGDVAVCDVVCMENGRQLRRFTHPEGLLSRREALNLLLTRRGINSGPCAKLFRRRLLEGLCFPPLRAYEDILFVRDALCRGTRIAVTNRTEYRYIQNPDSTMHRFAGTPTSDLIRVTGELLDFLRMYPELEPECVYVTVSHLMQYAQNPENRAFARQTRSLYRKYLGQILKCAAFPRKEKVLYILFTLGMTGG